MSATISASVSAQEQNKELLHRVAAAMNQHNLDAYDELIAPTYINYGMRDLPPGPEGVKRTVASFLSAFPDLQVALEEVIAEGDKVASRGTLQGTQRGAFFGVPPSGREIKVSFIDIWRAEDGKFVENWVQIDMLSMMQQLGALPTPAQK